MQRVEQRVAEAAAADARLPADEQRVVDVPAGNPAQCRMLARHATGRASLPATTACRQPHSRVWRRRTAWARGVSGGWRRLPTARLLMTYESETPLRPPGHCCVAQRLMLFRLRIRKMPLPCQAQVSVALSSAGVSCPADRRLHIASCRFMPLHTALCRFVPLAAAAGQAAPSVSSKCPALQHTRPRSGSVPPAGRSACAAPAGFRIQVVFGLRLYSSQKSAISAQER